MILCARYGGAEADLRFGSGALPGVFIVFYCGVADLPGNFSRKLSSEMYSGFIFFRV